MMLSTDWPTAGPGLDRLGRSIVWAIAVAFVVMTFIVGSIFLALAADEEICLDRSPWWGPPENPASTCSGHMYERRHGSSR